ncbi:CtrA inhibitor SciP [Salipiger marinus]|uniref:CtrA inhibitor SciP n=1 Tax=Salipiger marinus TaxID=555512 RepID=UPI004058FC79
MYLKKVDGPRAVTLPDGSIMTRADLPPPETRRWVASRKAAVVRAVRYGLLSEVQAQDRYGLSEEELQEWMRAVIAHGEEALKATLVQRFRSVSE